MRVHRLVLRAALQPPSPALPLVRLSSPLVPTRTFHFSRRRQVDFNVRNIEREADQVDVCIVGGGPSGLSAAIRLKQLANEQNRDIRVLLLEKGSEMGSPPTTPTFPGHRTDTLVGAHILSGAVIQTNALEELFPDWKENPPEPITPAKSDRMRFLTKNKAIPIPAPPQMHNQGNYIISLNNLCKWLAEKAEELGVEVYPGFGASEVSPSTLTSPHIFPSFYFRF
jgi:electron-transferring-flavoprotein dehydrogenase